ncbi:MAG TPA: amino acid adenylation domain-containing protein, partial [Anaerolineaceae bacterium]|nr:amino acid adenylation domain-containing protein [Anaerolineaceae bacterium]
MNEILRQVGALTPERREVFKQILSARGIDLSTLIFPLERGGRTEFAASFAQERLWFLDQLDPESPLYNIPCPVRMRGQLNLPALIASLNEITRRHEVLRTTFTARNGEPLQVIHPEIEFPLSFINLDTLPEEKRESEALRLAQGEASQPFHLETGPLVRLLLIRLAPREHIALLTFHHIIADGWSIGVFLRELATLYSARCANQDSPLPDLELQYCDYSAWQRERLSGKCLDEHLGYWKQQFAGPSPSLELPFDFPRPAQISGRGSVVHFSIPVEIATSFNRLCREQGVTLFMGLLGVFQTLLYRCTGQEDFCIGTPVAGRSVRDLEELIGFFVNTLPLMLHVSSDWTFLDLLRQTRDTCLEGFAHQEIPFEMLVDALGVERVTDQPPLFQVMFVLQNMPTTMYTLPDLILESISLHNSTSKYDLSLILGEENGQISGTLEYRDDLFLPASVERMGKYFSTLLESALSHPETCLGRLEILAPGDKHALLAFPKASFKIDSPSLHQRILQMASLHPETVAVICGDQQITYSQLDRISTALAHDLAAHGVMPDTPVGLYANRSVDAITAMLGILRAGGAYVPLDPNYPADRLSYISQNAQLKVVVAGPENQDLAVDLFPDQAVLHVQDAFDSESPASAEIILPASDPRHLAYILYTSGSTGRPKGVMIEHGSALHLLAAYEQVAPMTVPPVGTSVAPFGFDVSVQEIFSVLCWGGTLHILQQDMAANPEAIGQYLIDHGVNSAYFPPALLSDLAGWFEQNQLTLPLRRVLVGVEPIKQATLQRYVDLAPGIHVINGYGPTETTICATFYNFVEAKEPERRTPLGSPVPGYSVYLVDQNLQLSPPGAIGEILIAGPGLARGYLNNPELTAEKFISNPFADQPGEMAYRTGDLARILPDGLIEFVGRMDHQVKIRGFRVETGEVEHLLGSHPGVRSVVVLARNDPRSSSDSPEKHLIAYVIPDPSILQSPDVLRHYLKARLPEYMLPSAYVFMEAFPQTQNGKLDRKALPEPDWASQHNADKNSAPATPTEQILANLWGQILGIPQINRKDDFFELGGHSLMAMRLVSRIREVFRVDFALRQFFATHSLAEMASAIDQMLARGVDVPILPIRPISRLEPMLLSLGQQRLWFLDQFEPGNPVYNIPSAHRLKGSLDLNRLEAALSGVIARHEILRTTFPDQSGQPGLKILPELHIPIPLVNLSALPAAQCEAEAIRLVREESVRPFDLAKGPLLRMLLVRLAPEETIISLVMHHIISDGWSSGIFISELVSLYIAEVSGQPASLSDLPIQYADYAAWQREWLHGDVLDRQQKYWEARLADLPVLELPTDHPRPAVQTSNGAHYHFVLSAEMMPLLKTLALQENVTPFMLLLAAFQALLGR